MNRHYFINRSRRKKRTSQKNQENSILRVDMPVAHEPLTVRIPQRIRTLTGCGIYVPLCPRDAIVVSLLIWTTLKLYCANQ